MFGINADVIIAMVRLCEFYRDAIRKPEGYSTADIFKIFKGICNKHDLKDARKRLDIKSTQDGDKWYWSWGNEKSPEEVLEILRREMSEEVFASAGKRD